MLSFWIIILPLLLLWALVCRASSIPELPERLIAHDIHYPHVHIAFTTVYLDLSCIAKQDVIDSCARYTTSHNQARTVYSFTQLYRHSCRKQLAIKLRRVLNVTQPVTDSHAVCDT